MASLPSPAARCGRWLKNIALCFLMSGFALQLGGGITGTRTLSGIGLALLLLAIPLFILGVISGRQRS